MDLDRPGAPDHRHHRAGWCGGQSRHGYTANWRGSTKPPSDTRRPWFWRGAFRQRSLVFSGGSGALLTTEPPEAEAAGRLFEALGIAKDRITLEFEVARHLRERAFFGASARPAPRTALAARHLGLAHAARHGLLSPRKVRGGGLAGGLSRAAPPWSDAVEPFDLRGSQAGRYRGPRVCRPRRHIWPAVHSVSGRPARARSFLIVTLEAIQL